jgi:hypothetical protein
VPEEQQPTKESFVQKLSATHDTRRKDIEEFSNKVSTTFEQIMKFFDITLKKNEKLKETHESLVDVDVKIFDQKEKMDETLEKTYDDMKVIQQKATNQNMHIDEFKKRFIKGLESDKHVLTNVEHYLEDMIEQQEDVVEDKKEKEKTRKIRVREQGKNILDRILEIKGFAERTLTNLQKMNDQLEVYKNIQKEFGTKHVLKTIFGQIQSSFLKIKNKERPLWHSLKKVYSFFESILGPIITPIWKVAKFFTLVGVRLISKIFNVLLTPVKIAAGILGKLLQTLFTSPLFLAMLAVASVIFLPKLWPNIKKHLSIFFTNLWKHLSDTKFGQWAEEIYRTRFQGMLKFFTKSFTFVFDRIFSKENAIEFQLYLSDVFGMKPKEFQEFMSHAVKWLLNPWKSIKEFIAALTFKDVINFIMLIPKLMKWLWENTLGRFVEAIKATTEYFEGPQPQKDAEKLVHEQMVEASMEIEHAEKEEQQKLAESLEDQKKQMEKTVQSEQAKLDKRNTFIKDLEKDENYKSFSRHWKDLERRVPDGEPSSQKEQEIKSIKDHEKGIKAIGEDLPIPVALDLYQTEKKEVFKMFYPETVQAGETKKQDKVTQILQIHEKKAEPLRIQPTVIDEAAMKAPIEPVQTIERVPIKQVPPGKKPRETETPMVEPIKVAQTIEKVPDVDIEKKPEQKQEKIRKTVRTASSLGFTPDQTVEAIQEQDPTFGLMMDLINRHVDRSRMEKQLEDAEEGKKEYYQKQIDNVDQRIQKLNQDLSLTNTGKDPLTHVNFRMLNQTNFSIHNNWIQDKTFVELLKQTTQKHTIVPQTNQLIIEMTEKDVGGIIAEPTFAIIGEGPHPEIVIPISEEGLGYVVESINSFIEIENTSVANREQNAKDIVRRMPGSQVKQDRTLYDMRLIASAHVGA